MQFLPALKCGVSLLNQSQSLSMKLKINKWGTSAGVRLPKTLLELLQVKIGDSFDVVVNNDQMTLIKSKDNK